MIASTIKAVTGWWRLLILGEAGIVRKNIGSGTIQPADSTIRSVNPNGDTIRCTLAADGLS
jgi:hypothetical protein